MPAYLTTLFMAALLGFLGGKVSADAAHSASVDPVREFLQQDHQIDFYEYERIVSFEVPGVEDRRSFVRGGWFDDTMYWTWKSNSEDFTPSHLDGRFGEIRWTTTSVRHTTLFDARINTDHDSVQLFSIGNYTGDARILLHLGMPTVQFRTATWSDATFHALAALGPSLHDRTAVKGTITWISKNLYRVTVSHAQTAQPLIRVDVQGDDIGGSLSPRRIEVVQRELDDQGPPLRVLINVKSFTKSGTMRPADLDPLTLPQNTPRASLAFYSNNVLYAFAPGSTTEVIRVPSVEEMNALSAKFRRKPTWIKVFQVCVIAALILPPILVWRYRKQQKHSE
jgi:hypothetical protein